MTTTSTVTGAASIARSFAGFGDGTKTESSSSNTANGYSFFDDISSGSDAESLLSDYCWKNNVELTGSEKNEALASIDTSKSSAEIDTALAQAISSFNLKA